MKTNINSIMDTVDQIKELLSDIDKRLENIEQRLDKLEIPQSCDCIVDVDMNKINDLVWEIQKLLGNKK